MKYINFRTIKVFKNISLKLNKIVINNVRIHIFNNMIDKIYIDKIQNAIFEIILLDKVFEIPLSKPFKQINYFE